jgi:hypothetical protein
MGCGSAAGAALSKETAGSLIRGASSSSWRNPPHRPAVRSRLRAIGRPPGGPAQGPEPVGQRNRPSPRAAPGRWAAHASHGSHGSHGSEMRRVRDNSKAWAPAPNRGGRATRWRLRASTGGSIPLPNSRCRNWTAGAARTDSSGTYSSRHAHFSANRSATSLPHNPFRRYLAEIPSFRISLVRGSGTACPIPDARSARTKPERPGWQSHRGVGREVTARTKPTPPGWLVEDRANKANSGPVQL